MIADQEPGRMPEEPLAQGEHSAGVAQPAAVPSYAAASLAFALRTLPYVAALSCATMLFSRALVPALRGWLVGLSNFIDFSDVVAAAMSQMLALVLIASLGALALLLLRSRVPTALRLAGVFFGVLAAFAALTTIGVPHMPPLIHLVLMGCASACAFVFGADATRSGGPVGMVPVLVGAASALRGGGAFWADQAATERRDLEEMRKAFETAQWLTTAALVLLVAASVVALVSMFRADRTKTGVGLLLALAVGLAIGLRAVAPVDDLEPAWGVLLRRFGQQLVTRPAPFGPELAPALLAVTLPALAVLALVVHRRSPAVGAAISLSLLAGSSAEIPLLGLGLIVAAVGLALDRRDPHGVLAAVAGG